MPYTALIQNFNTKHNAQLDPTPISGFMTSIFTTTDDNEIRNDRIKEFIVRSYPDFAANHTRSNAMDLISKNPKASTATPWEFMSEYIAIVSAIARATSDKLIADAKQEQDMAKDNLRKIMEETKPLIAEVNSYIDAKNTKFKGFKEKYDAAVEAKAKQQKAELKVKNAFRFDTPYEESSLDYFGISENQAETMLNGQINAVKYIDARLSQLKATKYGVKNPLVHNELEEVKNLGVTYKDASDDVKLKLQEVHVIKDIMEKRLARHNFIWKWWFKKETQAMENYVKSAKDVLEKAGFTAADGETAMAMSEKGYNATTAGVADSFTQIKEKFAQNEIKLSDIRQQKEERERRRNQKLESEQQNLAKEAAKNEKFDVVKEKPLKEQLFSIYFRPSRQVRTLKEQRAAMKEIKADYIDKGANIPENAKKVFEANCNKIEAMKNAVNLHTQTGNAKKLNAMNEKCEAIETELLTDESLKDYQPLTEQQLKATLIEKFPVDLGENNNANVEVQPKYEEKQVEKEPVINNH